MRDLRELLADPGRVVDLTPDEALSAIEALAALRAALAARLRAMPEAPKPDGHALEDRLLTAEQAAERLGLRPSQVYRRAARFPFTRRLGRETVRFSEAGLVRYLDGLARAGAGLPR